MSYIKKVNIVTNLICLSLINISSVANGAMNESLNSHYSSFAVAAVLCITVVASFGTMSQSHVARGALEGIARNPESAGKVFVPMILSLALMESLVLFSLLISFVLLGKIE